MQYEAGTRNYPELLPLKLSCLHTSSIDSHYHILNYVLPGKGSSALINSTRCICLHLCQILKAPRYYSVCSFLETAKCYSRKAVRNIHSEFSAHHNVMFFGLPGSYSQFFLTWSLDKQEISCEVGKHRLKSKNNIVLNLNE